MRRLFLGLVAAILWGGLAHAQSIAVADRIIPIGAPNACAPYPLYLDFAAGAPLQCYNNAPTTAPPTFTGLTETPGALSGAGASVTNIPDGSGGLTGITTGNALSSAAGLFVEPATSNIIEKSTAFTGSPWVLSGQTVTGATSTGPNGVTDGVTLTGTGTFGSSAQPVTFTTGTPEVCFVWLKNTGAGANQTLASVLINDVGHGAVEAGITDTTVGSAGGASSIGFAGAVTLTSFEKNLTDPTGHAWANGWEEIVLHLAQSSTPANAISLIVAAGPYSGVSSSGDTIFAWHANCSPSNAAFDLPNSSGAAAVTRSADVLTQTVPTSGQSTFATVTYNATHTQQLAPATTLDLASALDAWSGVYPINHVIITTPPAVPTLASAAGYNVLTDYVPLHGFTTDNVDTLATLKVGYQFYIGAFFGQSASSYTNQLSITGGDLNIGGSTNNGMLVTATAIPGTTPYRGFAPGGGFYIKLIASVPIGGSQFTGTISGTTLTVNALNEGTPTVGGAGVGDELYVATVDQGVHLASGTGPYTLSGTPSGGNVGPTAMTSAYSQGGGWAAPLWHMSVEHLDGGGLDQWIGQAAGYGNYAEQDGSEQFMGNFGAYPWYSSYTGHHWYGSAQNTSHAFQQQVYTSNATVNVTYEEVWTPATASTSGSWSTYYNGVLNGTNSWTQFVQQTNSAATAPSTGSAAFTLGSGCPTNVAAGMQVVDTTISNLAAGLLGTVLTCSGTSLTMNAVSAHNGNIGDVIVINEAPTPVSKPWDMGIVDLQHPVPIAGCTLLTTLPCKWQYFEMRQASTAGNLYN